MLVLTRHVHQSIVIGHDVVVTVLEVRGDQVRLGITAPKDIQVHREEVFAALTAANRQAATSASDLEVLKILSVEPRSGPTEVVLDAPARPPSAGAEAGAEGSLPLQREESNAARHDHSSDRGRPRVPVRGPNKPERTS
jgi:carbon storage regulator